MQVLDQNRLWVAEELVPRVRRDGAARVFLGEACEERLCRETPRWGPKDIMHPQAEAAFFISGTSRMWLGDRLAAFRGGDVLVIPAGLMHYPDVCALRVVSAPAARSLPTSLWITAYPAGGSMLLMQMAGDYYEVSGTAFLVDPLLPVTFETLVAELREKGRGHEVMVQSCLLALLAIALRTPAVPTPSAAMAVAPDTAPATDGLVAEAKRFLHTRYSEELSLPRLASHLFVSESHLSRTFRRETGMTVIGYLTRVRISVARELLQTDLPIHRVAALVGLRDPLYFSQVFRRVVGVPPSRYRASLFAERR